MSYYFLLILGIGAVAQLVDGALGMGFGASSASMLVAIGLAPAISSASVHTAEIVTSFASGAAHLRLGNVDRVTLLALAVPGCIGGIAGAAFLSRLDPTDARPLVGVILFALGAVILLRFLRRTRPREFRRSTRRVVALGFFAATVDAFGGGGWGPISTPGLILGENHEPRRAIGTVNLAEFFVTVSIVLTFVFLVGPQNFRWDWVLALALGGVIMAPIAAHVTKRIPARTLGVLVGVLLMLLNGRTILNYLVPLEPAVLALSTAMALSVVTGALVWRILRPAAT